MRLPRPLSVTAALALALATFGLPIHSPSPAAAAADRPRALSERVSFSVRNVNRSLLPCAADGGTYRLHGRLIRPARTAHRPHVRLATVYVHDFATGGWFWRFPDPRRNHVRALARQGQVSLVLDRLGYAERPGIDGDRTCLGAQADMLHQVVTRLRTGRYRSSGNSPTTRIVVTSGHSVGAGIAELEATSFQDVNGLALMSWSDAAASDRAVSEAGTQTQVCAAGGDDRARRPAYAFFGQLRADFRDLLFHSAPPRVRVAASRMRNPDPCGDVATLGPMVTANSQHTRTLNIPVLLLFGARDALNRDEAPTLQSEAYGNAAEVHTHVLPRTGSAIPLERKAPRARSLFTDWLCDSFACGDGTPS